ncbi:MAG: trypsin-like peptidase domain-containing protein [Planctomycetes bacterium]|nr:trypsin-like peptidase domain-containing protein [Planctomycetota bacterium]
MDRAKRQNRNEAFLQRLLVRRPQERELYERTLRAPAAMAESALEKLSDTGVTAREWALETIVSRERPVLFVKDGQFDTTDVTTLGNEAVELVGKLKGASAKLLPVLPLIGRIDVEYFPGAEFLGTGWFVDTDIVVTNRHVASLIARQDGRKFMFSRGVAGRTIVPSLCNAHEYDNLAPGSTRVFKIKEVLYIEPENGKNDIAFVRVERRVEGSARPYITIAAADIADDVPVCVIGYPARASSNVIPDQALMKELYRGRYDVKRAAPGLGMGTSDGTSEHDCTTLGGNSGSVVLNLNGEAVGLHFAGLYREANYAVPASILRNYISRKAWESAAVIEPGHPSTTPTVEQQGPSKPVAVTPSVGVSPSVASLASGSITLTLPITITVSLGTPTAGTAMQTGKTDAIPIDAAHVDEAVNAYWEARPEGVLGARVGYLDEGDEIGDRPCIAASVSPQRLAECESSAASEFQGVPIRYLAATVNEQIEALPKFESVDSIDYDDDARTSNRFSFDPVDEMMDVTLHVGPEYSWEVLQQFLREAEGELVSAMYEFHAEHIKDAIEERLKDGASLKLVLDNATFVKVKNADSEFERAEVFEDWAKHYDFERVVAPEGTSGLISDSYHIKVTVRPDDTFWLSSGNWKADSSQPIVTQAQRDNASTVDLPGNREWHVVIKNKTLANRFRNHIRQDFKRSTDLGGRELPKSQLESVLVDVPLEEGVVLERRPPSRVVKPKTIHRKVKVRPLLTPDREGEVFSTAVLELIRLAKKSLLFQIPYISMPSKPREDRGYIDQLIRALTDKLKSLDDARVILRSGGQKFSGPTHAAWYFKSKGVDIDDRLRVIDNHHTKGMIVDGRRVLLGSHNWSKPGVTLNRDASLIFDDDLVASYYADAFEIDWERANAIKPRRFVKPESPILEAVGDVPPWGYRRVPLSELLTED